MIQTLLAKIQRDRNLSDLLKHSGMLYAGGIFSLGLTFLQQVTTASLLGVEDYGRLAIILSSGLLVFWLIDFRTWEVGTKFIAHAIAQHDETEIARVFTSLLLLEIFTSTIGLLAILLLAQPVAVYLLKVGDLDWLIRVYALTIPFRALSVGVASIFPRLYSHFDWLAWKSVGYALLRLALMTGAAWLGFGLIGVVVGALVGEIINCCLIIGMLFAIRRRYLPRTQLIDTRRPYQYAEGLRLLRQLWVSSSLAALHYQTFLPMVALLTTPAAVGLIRIGMDISDLIEKTVQPLSIVFSPRIMSLYESGEWAAFRIYLQQSALLLALITVPLSTILILFSNAALPVVFSGIHYDGLVEVVIVLIVGYAVHTMLQWWVRPAMIAVNIVKQNNMINFILIIISFIGLIILVPLQGGLGGALVKGGFLAIYALLSLAQLMMRLRHLDRVAVR